MFDFFAGASPALGLLVLGVVVLGAALAYGVFRSGRLRPANARNWTRIPVHAEILRIGREPRAEEERGGAGL